MKRILLSLTFILPLTFIANAQKPIEIQKQLGTVYMQDGKILRQNELKQIISVNPEAAEEYKTGATNNVVGSIFGGIGGFCIGYPLGTMLAGGEPNWVMAGIGAGFIGVAIPFSMAATKRINNAVSIYNNDLEQKSDVSLYFGPTQNGVGLCLRF